MIFSGTGLTILGNWKEGNTALFFLVASEQLPDGRRVDAGDWCVSQIIESSVHPARIALRVWSEEGEGGDSEFFEFDLTNAAFDFSRDRWRRLLVIALANKTRLLLAEPIN